MTDAKLFFSLPEPWRRRALLALAAAGLPLLAAGHGLTMWIAWQGDSMARLLTTVTTPVVGWLCKELLDESPGVGKTLVYAGWTAAAAVLTRGALANMADMERNYAPMFEMLMQMAVLSPVAGWFLAFSLEWSPSARKTATIWGGVAGALMALKAITMFLHEALGSIMMG